jgi:hypothetical protein
MGGVIVCLFDLDQLRVIHQAEKAVELCGAHGHIPVPELGSIIKDAGVFWFSRQLVSDQIAICNNPSHLHNPSRLFYLNYPNHSLVPFKLIFMLKLMCSNISG